MKTFGVMVLFALVFSTHAKSLPDEAEVVSVYTTQPSTSGTGLDVYQQIANNLAERISTPIYRFFGLGKNKTEEQTTKKPLQNIELLDDDGDVSMKKNEIPGRDVEELSVEALNRPAKKPEKVTLYSSYLPLNERLENKENDTSTNEVNVDTDDDFDDLSLDDLVPTEREGPFVYFLEWIGQLLQLAWGALSAIFKPSSSQS